MKMRHSHSATIETPCVYQVFDTIVHILKDIRVHLEFQSCPYNVRKLGRIASISYIDFHTTSVSTLYTRKNSLCMELGCHVLHQTIKMRLDLLFAMLD